jgi:creatinine amidohydrolase
MLVPVGVIEQHGPHLPLGTDIYAATLLCRFIKRELTRGGVTSVIAPPYYFGINETTGMFPGSISIRREAMVSVLSDLFLNYAAHGFKRQFVLNHHGDPQHNRALIEAVRLAVEGGADVSLVAGGLAAFSIERAIQGSPSPFPSSAVLKVEDSEETKEARKRLNRSRMHIHAEERETSLIMRWFPDLLKLRDGIAGLKPAVPPIEVFYEAAGKGKWRELSPLGYIGDPAVASPENGELYTYEALDIASAIVRCLSEK